MGACKQQFEGELQHVQQSSRQGTPLHDRSIGAKSGAKSLAERQESGKTARIKRFWGKGSGLKETQDAQPVAGQSRVREANRKLSRSPEINRPNRSLVTNMSTDEASSYQASMVERPAQKPDCCGCFQDCCQQMVSDSLQLAHNTGDRRLAKITWKLLGTFWDHGQSH